MNATRWSIRPTDQDAAQTLVKALKIPEILARVLVARSFDTPELAEAYLRPTLAQLPSPFGIKGMREAAQRLQQAMRTGERIVIWGDYDVDGMTSTTILRQFLSGLGVDSTFRIPHRSEGYGLTRAGLESVAADGPGLLITVDCGTTSIAEVEFAQANGLETIVVDHHKVGTELPRAILINPMQVDCGYPYKHMASAGLVFQLIIALRSVLRDAGYFSTRDEPNLAAYLDLVALGTVADASPLTGVNRILVANGLRALRRTNRPGVAALIAVAGLEGELQASQIGFQLGPRLNAAGRLGHAADGVRLLCSESRAEADVLARRFDALNQERRAIQDRIFGEAVAEVDAEVAERGIPGAVVVAREGWHAGVIGIVASKLMERYWRPAVVIALEDGLGRGSARSVAGFDMVEGLRAAEGCLERFGGHRMAAGLTVRESRIEELRVALVGAAEAALQGELLQRPVVIDSEVTLGEVDEELVRQLQRMGPFGLGNPAPVLVGRSLGTRDQRVVGKTHLSFKLSDGVREIPAIGFDLVSRFPAGFASGDVVFQAQFNRFQGVSRLQLNVKDVRPL